MDLLTQSLTLLCIGYSELKQSITNCNTLLIRHFKWLHSDILTDKSEFIQRESIISHKTLSIPPFLTLLKKEYCTCWVVVSYKSKYVSLIQDEVHWVLQRGPACVQTICVYDIELILHIEQAACYAYLKLCHALFLKDQ